MAPLDVTTTNQVTTITAKQLQILPLQRSAEDIAMLAPGVNMGSPELTKGPLGTPINVFGGATIAENAYYIDGMNTTEALNARAASACRTAPSNSSRRSSAATAPNTGARSAA